MSQKTVMFPPATVERIAGKIAQYPGCQVGFYEQDGHWFVQVYPAQVAGATVRAADAPILPAPDNDSFICPGDPRCPK